MVLPSPFFTIIILIIITIDIVVLYSFSKFEEEL